MYTRGNYRSGAERAQSAMQGAVSSTASMTKEFKQNQKDTYVDFGDVLNAGLGGSVMYSAFKDTLPVDPYSSVPEMAPNAGGEIAANQPANFMGEAVTPGVATNPTSMGLGSEAQAGSMASTSFEGAAPFSHSHTGIPGAYDVASLETGTMADVGGGLSAAPVAETSQAVAPAVTNAATAESAGLFTAEAAPILTSSTGGAPVAGGMVAGTGGGGMAGTVGSSIGSGMAGSMAGGTAGGMAAGETAAVTTTTATTSGGGAATGATVGGETGSSAGPYGVAAGIVIGAIAGYLMS